MNIEHRTLNVQHRILNSARREPQGQIIGSNDQFKKKTEQSESTLRNSIRLSPSDVSSGSNGSSQAEVQYSPVFRSRLQRDSLVLK